MSEKMHHSPETSPHKSPEHHHSPEVLNKHTLSPEQESKQQGEIINKAHAEINKEAKSKKEYEAPSQESNLNDRPLYINSELKDMAYKRSLVRVRKNLSSVDRVFSKLVHQTAVEAVSEAVGKTIARPSGILGGSIFGVLASVIFFYVSKHYGFSYNNLIFGLFFSGGMVIGILIELSYSLIKKYINVAE